MSTAGLLNPGRRRRHPSPEEAVTVLEAARHARALPRPPTPRSLIALQVSSALLLAAAGSVLLVPRGVDLAGVRDRSGDSAAALQLLEQAVLGGDRSFTTRLALAQQRARNGQAAAAVALLQALAAERPDHVETLQALAGIGPAAQRPLEAQVRLLERLQQLAPERQRQRDLADLQAARGAPELQAAALAELIDRFQGGDVADHLLLAKLQLEQQQPALSLATLDRMLARFPDAAEASVVAAQMTALLASGDAPGALGRGAAWLQARPQALDLDGPLLAGALSVAGRADLGAALLEPFVSRPARGVPLLLAWAQALGDAGRPADALALLAAAGTTATDDEARRLRQLEVDLALAAGQLDAAAALSPEGLDRLALPTLLNLAQAARAAGQRELLARLATLARARAASDPLVAARLSLASGDRANALRWAQAAAARPGQALALALVWQQLDRADLARPLVQDLAAPLDAPALLLDYARVHVALNQPGPALAALAAAPPPASAEAAQARESAWALLAAAAGQSDALLHWLDSPAGRRARQADLLALVHTARAGHHDELALALGGQMLQRLGGAAQAARDGTDLPILLASGADAEALPRLETLASADPQRWLDAYAQAATRSGATARLLAWCAAQAGAAATPPALQARLVQLMLERRAFPQALPALERLTRADPRRWLGSFTDAATRSGQRRRLVALWIHLADTPGTGPELRGQIAFRLLEAGEKSAADRVLRALAATRAADDAATQRLLFAWGPRPTPDQLAWLADRATAASGSARADWLRLLTQYGGADRVLALVRRDAAPLAQPVQEAYLEALAALGDTPALTAALASVDVSGWPPQRLLHLATLVPAGADAALPRRLLTAAHSAGDQSPGTLRMLGLLAYRQRDLGSAERHLNDFNQSTGGDAETHRVLGEISLRQRQPGAARAAFARGLGALERADDHSFGARVARAGLLFRVGQPALARRLYEALIAERPQDDNLRADFAALLLDQGDTARARAVLEAR